ncbi:hemicentin-1 [Nilaparvata lugens]|uniref:hemicentin-1 n=1 Tax=Nilaparvata lugens TaxID=108931 RepID=UPI00193D945C|nr:hemicentin-1 [Nilaparvata lugens]
MPPVQWNTAYEEGSADNGYSLTNGNFDQESRYQFATGHELVIDAKGRGIDPDNGTLQVDIEVIGNIPMAQPKASVVIEPFTEDFVQTGPNRLFSSSESTVDVDGKQIPFFWNKTVSYDTELGTMPYPVERLATDEILSDYDADSQRLFYSAANSISSPYGRDKCPKGFKLDQRYQHCRDIDECKSKRTNDCHHSQTCENLFGTYRCICAEGFKLTANGKRCQDINECEEGLHECSHTCINTIGGYRCACPLGMILHQDTLTCKEDSYNYDSDFASDWGNDDSYNTQHNRRNLNYDEYDSLLALNQVREEWLCPPGQIREDNRCIEEKGKGGKEHCSLEKCGEHETCLPTVSGYRCVETRCPLLYQHDIQTRKCFAVCTESRCEKGAKEWEEITFVPLPLESASVQQYQDLLELSTEDESSNMIYTVAENEFNLPLRVRIENNAGILYSMRYFDFEGVNKVVIQATTYEDHTSTALSIYTFVVFVYDPSSI